MTVTINGSTGISGVDGSSGTPAVIGSDADTGLYFAAGQVQASLNGTAANVALVSGTAQASTSGTSIEFTSIPSWVKRITMVLDQVSLSGTADPGVQLGSGTYTTSGYRGTQAGITSTATAASLWSTLASVQSQGSAAAVFNGIIHICSLGSSNIWAISLNIPQSNIARMCIGHGTVTLGGTLDRVRLTSSNGTDTFDAGTVNIMYE